jgi:hypothetical protein
VVAYGVVDLAGDPGSFRGSGRVGSGFQLGFSCPARFREAGGEVLSGGDEGADGGWGGGHEEGECDREQCLVDGQVLVEDHESRRDQGGQ